MIEVEITSKRPEITIDLTKGPKKQVEIEIGSPHSGVAYPIYDGPTMIIPDHGPSNSIFSDIESTGRNHCLYR